MDEPAVPVGFDYAKALKEICPFMSYQAIADYIGYASNSSIERVINGATPPHPQGEAIWALYREMFEGKPPVSEHQAAGEY